MIKYGIDASINREGIYINSLKGLARQETQDGKFIYFTKLSVKEKIYIDSIDIRDYCKRNKGIGIENGEKQVIVYNDPFCSVPVYIGLEDNSIRITSSMEEFYHRGKEIDRIGFYEILIYGSGLYDRTLIDGVKQMPAASRCIIDKEALKFTIEPYWNFEVKENAEYCCLENAVKAVEDRLLNIFGEIKPDILIGMSGGLDSRLSACMLYKTKKSKDLSFFTFGYNHKILENKMAESVLLKLFGKKQYKHLFVGLTPLDYQKSIYVPLSTGGQIALDHIHQYACIRKLKKPVSYISNYYSDAVMGWDALPVREKESMDECDYYKRARLNKLHLQQCVLEQIEEDLAKVCKRYPQNGNFSCMNEFIYVTERNPKFHVRLSAVLADYVNVELPYADYELLEMMLSVPTYNRAEKLIEERIVHKYLGDMMDISSRRYSERSMYSESRYSLKETLYYRTGYFKMRGINFLNVIMARLTNYRIQFINPYLTENQNEVLNKTLYGEFQKALNYLKEFGLISGMLYDILRNKDYRAKNTSIKYNLIGISECVKRIVDK